MKTKITLLLIIVASACLAQNHPPVGVRDTVEVMEQVPILIDVKANDYDPDGDDFWISEIGISLHDCATIEIIDDKFWLKTKPGAPNPYPWYKLSDGQSSTDRIRFELTVLNNPDIPDADDDYADIMAMLPYQMNILENDSDPNGNAIKIYSFPNTYNCSLTLSEDSLSVTVIPSVADDEYYFFYNIIESNTPDLFISHSARVHGISLPNPNMPVIKPDEAIAIGGIETLINVLENDYDNQGDAIEVDGFTQPANGTVTLSNNKLRYTPSLSYIGTDFFYYNIRESADTSIYTDTAKVSTNVLKNPDCPVGVPDYATGMTGYEIIIDVRANDYDINNDQFVIKDVQEGSAITPDNKISYKSSFLTHADTIYYRIAEANNPDSYSEWTPVFITLTVNPDLPVAMPDTIRVRAGIPVTFKPLLNDIQNGADTLILKYYYTDGPTKHWGTGSVTLDNFNYTPIYQANGIDRFRYRINSSLQQSLAMGEIVIICESQFYDSLQISNINAGVNGGGFLFSRYAELPREGLFFNIIPGWEESFSAHFRYPKGAKTNTIFNSTIWAGGLDSQNLLHLAAERYKQGPSLGRGIDFQPGPIANQYNNEYLERYLRTWKVSAAQIEHHKNNYWRPGYQAPEAILNWPGNGKITNGEALTLAPYYDKYSDGIYNCMEGDYPLIRGDETIFLMFNDDLNHTESFGTRIGLEVHAMVYGFSNPADTAVYNSVFVHYDFYNRSDETYHNFYFGVFTDTDLGYAYDDYVGSDVADGYFYTYNGLPQDGNGEYWAYGENPPAQGIAILAGPFKDNDQEDNPAIDCSESINGLNYGNGTVDDERLGMGSFVHYYNPGGATPYSNDPQYADTYYNNMQALWLDETHMIYGGNGHPSTGAVGPDCHYMFPGDSDPLNWGTNCIQPNGGYNTNGKYWTEAEVLNPPEDRRGVASMGPVTFLPGQVQEMELAFCVGQATPGVPGSAIENLDSNINEIIEKVITGNLILPNSQLGFRPSIKPGQQSLIYPNPADENITFNIPATRQPLQYIIYDLLGNNLSSETIPHNQPRHTINISNLKPGIYIIRLFNSETNEVMKFIKK